MVVVLHQRYLFTAGLIRLTPATSTATLFIDPRPEGGRPIIFFYSGSKNKLSSHNHFTQWLPSSSNVHGPLWHSHPFIQLLWLLLNSPQLQTLTETSQSQHLCN
eukprot:Gb_22902 [translate_table: standard]